MNETERDDDNEVRMGATGGTGSDDGSDTNALLSRLRLIEDRPLDERAGAFSQIHDELQAALEGGDSPARHDRG